MPENLIDFGRKSQSSAFGDRQREDENTLRQKIKEIIEQLLPTSEDLSQLTDRDLIVRYQWLQRECEKAIRDRENLKHTSIEGPAYVPMLTPFHAIYNILESGKLDKADIERFESMKVVLIFSLLGYFQREIDHRKLSLPTMEELEKENPVYYKPKTDT